MPAQVCCLEMLRYPLQEYKGTKSPANMHSTRNRDLTGNPEFFGSRLKPVLDWLLPAHCVLCGMVTADRAGLCPGCAERIMLCAPACPRCGRAMQSSRICGDCQKSPPFHDEVIFAAAYTGAAGQLIREFKFGHKLYAGPALASLLLRRLGATGCHADIVAPVPLHASRLWRRGYNQSAELAAYLCRRLHVSLQRSLLTRIRATAPQTSLAEKQRRKNVRNAFKLNQDVSGKQVAIVDDVMTTGSTVNEIARVLKKAGAAKVSVWVVARA